MDVKFTTCPRVELDNVELINGQLIYLSDEGAAFYDMGNTRWSVSGVRLVDGLPSSGNTGLIYINIGTDPVTLWLWNDTTAEWVSMGGEYKAGTGLVLDGMTFNHSNVMNPGTAKGSDDQTLVWSGTFDLPYIQYDAQGHVVGKGITTMTMPKNPDTHWITRIYAGTGAAKNAVTTNGNTKLVVTDNNAVRNMVTLKGERTLYVTSDDAGNITFDSPSVSIEAGQGLTAVEQQNARDNMGLGTAVTGDRGVPGGLAELDSNGTVPLSQLPYRAGTGIRLNGAIINHSNSVTAGTAKGSDTKTLTFGGTFDLPTVTYDTEGHVTAKGVTTMTMPKYSAADGIKLDGTTFKHTNAVTAGTASGSATGDITFGGTFNLPTVSYDAQGHVTGKGTTTLTMPKYSAGTGLSLSGTTFNHSNSVTAGTASGSATKTLTFGGTFDMPTVSYDAQGHVTGKGTTTMTMPTYSAADGIKLDGTTFKHTNTITAGTAKGDNDETVAFGGTFAVPSVTYDAQGHITAKGLNTMTISNALASTAANGLVPKITNTSNFLKGDNTWTAVATGVKGNAETGYRTGNVNLTPANLGLGNVGNFKAVSTVANQGLSTTEQSNARANIGLGNAALENVGVANGVAELDANGLVPSSQLPSYVDDVLEYANLASFPATGETGKIYIAKDTNKTYRWSGSAYVVISETLALGETSSTAYRGDRGKIAYDHATAKGSAFTSGLYKIATNDQGHVTSATAVVKSDITGLGIPGSDTTYSANNGVGLSGTTFYNTGVRSVATGSANGTISVNTNGTAADVAVKGLGSAAYTASTAYATSGHTHTTTIATSTGTSQISLNANSKYVLTAGGTSYIFTTPVDTTYQSKAAVSGGTDVSLVTTGEKYNWSSKSSLALGETSSTAYRGDRGKVAYDHSQLTSGNPHNVTKTDVGLGNVGNFKAVSTVASQGLTDTEKSNARANIGAGTSSLTIGTTASTAAAGNHTHSLSLASDTGTSTVSLSANSKYKLTAGGNSLIFTTPKDTTYTAATAAPGNVASASVQGTSTNYARQDHTHGITLATGDSNGQVKIAGTNVSVKGLADLAYISKGTSTTTFLRNDGTWATPAGTSYTAGVGITISNSNVITNTGVRSAATGSTNGTISVNTNGTTADVAVKGLSDLAYISKGTDTTKYLRNDGTWAAPAGTSYTAGGGIGISSSNAISNTGVRSIATGSANGTISVNTNGTAADVAVKGLGAAAYMGTGTTSTTVALGNHTHTTTIAASTGTNQLTLAASTKYAITAGGTSYIFTTPPNTTYSAGAGIAISTANAISNSGVRAVATGTADGTISVNTNGTAANVAVKGLSDLAYISKGTDTTKFLRNDGTWVAPPTGATYTAGTAISISSSNQISVSTVPIANGGTGATTRTGAMQNLTNESVSSPGYVVGMTDGWANVGYTTIDQLRSTLTKVVTGTLAANATSVTFSSSLITTSSSLSLFCSDASATYTSGSVSAGSATFSGFTAKSSARSMKLYIL